MATGRPVESLETFLGPAPVPHHPLLVSFYGFGDPRSPAAEAEKRVADCGRAVAKWMTRQSALAAPGSYEMSSAPHSGYDHSLSLKGGSLPCLWIKQPQWLSGPRRPPGTTDPIRGTSVPTVMPPFVSLDQASAMYLVGEILRADRQVRTTLIARKSLTLFKALSWSPNCLMPELSVHFTVLRHEDDQAPVQLAQPTALAIACVLLRTANLNSETGHHDLQPWLMRTEQSTTLAAALKAKLSAENPERWLEHQRAIADLTELGLKDLADALKHEANAALAGWPTPSPPVP